MGNREFYDVPVNSPAFLLRFKTSFMRFGESFENNDLSDNISVKSCCCPCSYPAASGSSFQKISGSGSFSGSGSGSGAYFGLGYGIELI